MNLYTERERKELPHLKRTLEAVKGIVRRSWSNNKEFLC